MRSALVPALVSALAAGCGGAAASPAQPALATDPGYPAGPYSYDEGDVLPDLQFAGKIIAPGYAAEWIDPQTISLGSLRSDGVRFFVIEAGAVWCDDCVGDQPAMMQLESDYGPRGVLGVEILVEGGFDIPASAGDLDNWSLNHGVSGILLLDAGRAFGHAAGVIAFPTYFIVDSSDMRVVARSNDPMVAMPLGPLIDGLLAN